MAAVRDRGGSVQVVARELATPPGGRGSAEFAAKGAAEGGVGLVADLLGDGLAQVWRKLTGEAYQPPRFHTPSLYKLVRHPLYVGWLVIFWSAPTMTAAHLLFALVTSAYILMAIRSEERDLVTAVGEVYCDYRRRTPMLAPRLGRR